jgi:hypothetical protein
MPNGMTPGLANHTPNNNINNNNTSNNNNNNNSNNNMQPRVGLRNNKYLTGLTHTIIYHHTTTIHKQLLQGTMTRITPQTMQQGKRQTNNKQHTKQTELRNFLLPTTANHPFVFYIYYYYYYYYATLGLFFPFFILSTLYYTYTPPTATGLELA